MSEQIMNEPEITLKTLFLSPEGELPEGALSIIESGQPFLTLKDSIAKEIKGLRWNYAREEIMEKIGDLMDVSLVGVMGAAWKKYEALLKYADSEKYPPDEMILAPLAEHTLTSEHHPYLEILINDQSVVKIEFTITLALSLDGFVLKIQDTKIKGIQVGSIEGNGTITMGETVLVEKGFDAISIPGSIDLGEGIPIEPWLVPKIEHASLFAAEVNAFIQCGDCQTQVLSAMLPLELENLVADDVVRRSCDNCGKQTSWAYVGRSRQLETARISEAMPDRPHEAMTEESADMRIERRVGLQVPILVRGPKGEQEIARSENLSEGGLGVSLSMNLNVDDALSIVCPYVPGGQGLGNKAQVRHRTTPVRGDTQHYGFSYVR